MAADTAAAPAGPRRRLFGTVRLRITALATTVVAVVLVVTALGLVTAQQRALTEGLDESLEQRADDLQSVSDARTLGAVLGNDGDEDAVSQLVGADGQVLAASRELEGAGPLGPSLADGGEEVRTTDAIPSGDGSFRLLSRGILTEDGAATLHVAASLEDVREATGILVRSLLIAIPLVVLVLAVLIWWLVGRTLRPVDAIREEVASISGAELHRRVPEPPGDDEIASLARTMNTMLDRIEQASIEQQRFVADASHELRSPLTRIRSELEVDLTHPEDADPVATERSVLEETVALQRLVDDLLLLARTDAGAALHAAVPVDLDDLVLREARRLRSAERVTVDVSAVSAAQVVGDPAQLQRVVRNLADNAQRHAAGAVAFALAEEDGQARLVVRDDGAGIPAADRDRIFERFTRLDDARARQDGGAGLGLAIVREIVTLHGGTIEVAEPEGAGAAFVVQLPLAPAASVT
jgi:signal transduction histidine kinase